MNPIKAPAQQAADPEPEPAPEKDAKPKQFLLPAPEPEEITPPGRSARTEKSRPRHRTDAERAWSKTVETVKSI
ncbi:hypothetical protein Salmuc_02153 [Salipiger mucosus DSM 16094]|uniref:Uncharacterized protein n=2 Tax=Salipiger mucosus TaxID=263378 RepID=S9S002_9RHOB|nr:hypothetical protein Salmuc_02153 [Salipiger mucosus DSM 16094]